MSSYHYNSTDIVCVLQAKPEHSFSHARSIAFREFCWPGNADHRIVNLSVAWLIMKSRLLQCYISMYMTLHWLLASKASICLKLICQVIDSKYLYLVVGHLC